MAFKINYLNKTFTSSTFATLFLVRVPSGNNLLSKFAFKLLVLYGSI